MKRREAKEEIEKILAKNIVEERVFQLKPWTCYTAKSVASGGMYHLLGFTKVMHPDDWDPDEGVELAKKKAIAFCAKKIMLWFSFHWDCPQEVCPWDALIERWLDGTLSHELLSGQAYVEAAAEMERRYGVVRFDT